jgi:anti-sigma-K factor RskA
MTEHGHWEELAAGYALDALDPDERAEFEAHLEQCETCRAQVDQHALVAAQLGSLAGDDAGEAPPWSAVRAGVLGGTVPTPAPAGDVVPLRQRQHWLTVAAAAVAAVAVAVTAWQVTRGGSTATAPVASVSACRATPGCHVVPLRAADTAPATVLVNGKAVTVVATSMPAPPAGNQWALWQVPRTGAPRLLAEFGAGNAEAALTLPYDDTAAFAVSKERTGATPAKPSEIVATGETR